VKRKGSTWSVHQKGRGHENVLMEMVESWLAEKENRRTAVSCARSSTPY